VIHHIQMNQNNSDTPSTPEGELELSIDSYFIGLDLWYRTNGKRGYPLEKAIEYAEAYTKSRVAKVIAEAELDPFDFVRPCVPDCSPDCHAQHKGQWDMAVRINTHYDELHRQKELKG
jgi:hypothetical protein